MSKPQEDGERGSEELSWGREHRGRREGLAEGLTDGAERQWRLEAGGSLGPGGFPVRGGWPGLQV